MKNPIRWIDRGGYCQGEGHWLLKQGLKRSFLRFSYDNIWPRYEFLNFHKIKEKKISKLIFCIFLENNFFLFFPERSCNCDKKKTFSFFFCDKIWLRFKFLKFHKIKEYVALAAHLNSFSLLLTFTTSNETSLFVIFKWQEHHVACTK